ncbi:MAG: RdgB/HAM1 family non-canonical purine NTP pyrophosphatase [Promethearchaeota archaeon]|nr:MAG: RdgB/HAM1 family non-canonical purine NTP pyrophosphatase [Candidatus Lokiarchaeota archaeon]
MTVRNLNNDSDTITIMSNDRDIIYFITGNKHKYLEIANLFETAKVSYHLKQKDLPTVEIQADTLKEVAIYKLQSIQKNIRSSYFIEDAGFFIDVPLNGFPGVYSKYVLHTIGNEGILRLINDYDSTKAHFETVIALYHKSLDKILVFEGRVEGVISPTKKGDYGFGFDPIFIPNELPYKTFAELATFEKNQISHRAKAWNQMLKFLEEN